MNSDDKLLSIACGVLVFLVAVSIILGVILLASYHTDFRARCTERGGIVTQVGGSGKDVCLGADLKILEVAQW